LPEKDKKFLETANIHSLFDLQPISMSFTKPRQSETSKIDLCSSYFHHMKKILFIVGAFFAIAVEM